MADWPRELHGHTVARKLDFIRSSTSRSGEAVGYHYYCVGCGLKFEGPDDPRLQTTGCYRGTRQWNR